MAFASNEMGDLNLEGRCIKANVKSEPLGIELAFVTEDVVSAYTKAIAPGVTSIKETEKCHGVSLPGVDPGPQLGGQPKL